MKKTMRQVGKHRFSVLVWLLILSLIVPMFPPPRAAASGLPIRPAAVTASIPFGDVSPTDWYYEAVTKMQEKGIFSGTDAHRFSPKGTMTRAMYVTALGRMAGADVGAAAVSSFADVPAGSWYAPYVEWAAKQGIVEGTGSGKFSPDATVSREQMAAMTLRYFESYRIPYQTETAVATKPRDLASISSWADDAVIKLWQAGVFTGDEQGNFNPRAQASRAEAAVLFARSSAVVDVWKGHNSPIATSPTPTIPTTSTSPSVTPPAGGNSGNAETGSNPGTSNPSYMLTFESNGGTAIAAQTVRSDQVLTNLPVPTKEGYIFQGWFADRDLTSIFADGSKLSGNTTLYAKYIDNANNAVQSVPSYSVLDVSSDFSIQVEDRTGSLTAAQVKAGMKFADTADPEFAGVTVTGGNGSFTVASAAEDGKFAEGHTYQLRLTDDDLIFTGQDATTDIYVFSVAKQEVLSVPLNPNMIYLHFSEVTNMKLNGAQVGSPSIPVMTTTVGGSGNSLADANAASGTFGYEGDTPIKVGDTVAIYTGIRPDQRTVATDGMEDGEIAYVQITAVDGKTYSYGRAEADQVVFKPDVLPVSMEADTDGDPANHSITVEHVAMNYSAEQYAPLGLNELTTVDVGDFIGFYEGGFAQENFKSVGYGRITSITPAAEMDIITYTDATLEDVTSAFDVYQKQAIDGDQLLTEEQIDRLETQIEQQARKSGFVDQAGDYLSDVAMEMPDFKAQTFLAGGDKSRVSVEDLTVVAKLGTTLKNIQGRTSGVSATLQVGADIVVELNDDSNMVIHMTSTFVQEISLDLDINSDTSWHWYKISTFFGDIPIFPVIDDYVVTANLDAYSYTGMNITAEVGFVESGGLEDVLEDWADAQTSGKLKQVKNIANEIKAVLEGVQDTDVGAEALQKQYQEMLEKDTEWVTLFKKPLVEKSARVALGIIEVKFEAEFVVSAQVNLTIGADFYYKMAKRYSVTVRVLSFSGSSSTVSLPSDGDYQFTFYVMGTIGLRAGIHMEVKAGIGSVKLNSIGVAVEPGVYINLWGYFYYQLKNISGVKTTKSIGALFVEIGIYLDAELGAQLGDGALSGAIELVSEEWPLYTIGEQNNVYDFNYEQDEKLGFTLKGAATSVAVPESLLTMKTFDLKSGNTGTQSYHNLKDPVYNPSRFDIRVDNPDFRYDSRTQKIEVANTRTSFSKGNLIITWKGAPLSFTSNPIKRTIPLVWLARDGDYTLQLDPQNGGMTQIISAGYNAPLNIMQPVYPGYTFNGWYTAATRGTKVTIPSRMPAEDNILYAQWVPSNDTPYKVEHYLMDPNTRKAISSSPTYTQVLKGTTNAEIRMTSDRFKDQGYASGETSGSFIKSDGSTVVKIAYYPAYRTISFDLNDPGSTGKTITEMAGKNIASRIPVPTRKGYTFTGWTPEIQNTMPAENTTYTATWKAAEDTPYQVVHLKQNMASDTYTVADTETYRGITGTETLLENATPKSYEGFTFDENVAGTVLKSQIASSGKTVLKLYYKRDVHALTVDYNGAAQPSKTVDVPFGATLQLYLGTPTRPGHAFAGWSPTPPTTMPAEDLALTAQWTSDAYTVSFDSNGAAEEIANQKIEYGQLALKPIEPTKDGYVFGGWYSDSPLSTAYDFATPVTGDIELYAKWLHVYTVSFESNDGSAVDAQIVNEGSKANAPTAPVLDGYVFSGWYKDSELTIPYDFTTSIVESDLTLYAKWTVYVPNTYTVSFDSNGGSQIEAQIVNEGAVATAPIYPTLAGHQFGGWYSDIDLTIPYGFTEGVQGDLTLYAKWVLNRYTVSFDAKGGTIVNSQSVNEGESAVSPAAPTRAGYTFGGWYTSNTLTNLYDFATPVTSNLTLYAKWTAIYTVTFDSDGGSSVPAQTVEYDGKAAAPVAPTKNGYIFNGWYSDQGRNEAYNFAMPVTTPLTLYAKWTSNKHTVDFDSQGGSDVQNQQVSPGDRATEPAVPTREGYAFEAWYSDPEGTQAYDFQSVVTDNLTLYAKWRSLPWYQVSSPLTVTAFEQFLTDGKGTFYASHRKNYYTYLEKYEGGTWKTIYSKIKDGQTVQFALDRQGVPYLTDYSYTDHKIIVQKYNGTTWEDVVSEETLTGIWSTLSFDPNNVLYVTYKDSTNQLAVAKYEDNHWVALTGGESLGSSGDFVSLKFAPDHTPYLWNDTSSGSTRNNYQLDYADLKVFKYENGAWELVGNPIRIQGTTIPQATIDFDSQGTLYVLHSIVDLSLDPYKWKLIKYNGFGWEQVGDMNPAIRTSTLLGLAFDKDDIPYVAYTERENGFHASVMKYEGEWTPVGELGFTPTLANQIQLLRDQDGNLNLAYQTAAYQAGNVLILKHRIE